MNKKILASIIFIILIGTLSIPSNVMADDKNSKADDDHGKHPPSCTNIPDDVPFRYLWIFVCSLQSQIDQINARINHNALFTLSCTDGQIPKFSGGKWICGDDQTSSGGGGGTTGGASCPTATNIDLSNAHLELQNLSGCNLKNAVLFDADLRFTNLHGADFTNANLEGTFLNNADLSGAILDGTNFQSADLTGADTTGCHGTPHGTPISGALPVCGP